MQLKAPLKSSDRVLIDLISKTVHVDQKFFSEIKRRGAPVVLWGTGDLSWYIFEYLGQNGILPYCFCDNDPFKQNTKHFGLPVYGYERMRDVFATSGAGYSIVISVGPQYKDAIVAQIAHARDPNPFWYFRGYELRGRKIDYSYFLDNLSLFQKSFDLLSDEISRRVFVNVLNAKLTGDFTLYKAVQNDLQYFDTGIVQLSDFETLLDVGAYKGDTIFNFISLTRGRYDSIIALEADPKTCMILKRAIAEKRVERIEVLEKGAWNRPSTLFFCGGREGSSRIVESAENESVDFSIQVDTIDNILSGRKVTFICMDIEGSERNAILGAENVIKTHRPRIAVCVYHRREDLFDIPLLLSSMRPDYKYYLRHYSDNQTETVLFAV